MTARSGAATAGKSTGKTIGFGTCGISAAIDESAGLTGLIGITSQTIANGAARCDSSGSVISGMIAVLPRRSENGSELSWPV